MRFSRVILISGCLLATVPAGALGATTPDSEIIGGPGCSTLPQQSDGTYRQEFDSVDVNGQIAGTPPRIITDIQRGDAGTLCVGFQNRTGEPISLDIDIANVGIDDKGLPASKATNAEFGAASWVTPSATKIVDLAHGEMAWIKLAVDVPADAVTGSSYASVVATQRLTEAELKEGGSQVRSVPSIALQVFFDVPGNADYDGRVVDERVPGVVWWDGLDLGDLPVLDKLRGLGIATIRFGWRNDGNLSDDVSGTLVVTSDLTGKEVARIKVDKRLVLRGSTRSFDVTWSKDIPMFGRFTPTLEMTGSDGTKRTVELDSIWVIPSWWYLLALGLAIGIPLWLRRRSKRRYNELVERVEAAESRAADAGADEDWDSDEM